MEPREGMALNDMHTSRKRFTIDTDPQYLAEQTRKIETARILEEEKKKAAEERAAKAIENNNQIIENANNGIGNLRYCFSNECEEKIAMKLNANKVEGWVKCHAKSCNVVTHGSVLPNHVR